VVSMAERERQLCQLVLRKGYFYLSPFMCNEYLWLLCADNGARTAGEEMPEITPCELVSLNIQCILLGQLSFIFSWKGRPQGESLCSFYLHHS
jgi:hypothetical protein